MRAETMRSRLAIKLDTAAMATKVACQVAADELERAEREAIVLRDLVQLATAERLQAPADSERVWADADMVRVLDKVSRLRELRMQVEREVDR